MKKFTLIWVFLSVILVLTGCASHNLTEFANVKKESVNKNQQKIMEEIFDNEEEFEG